MSFGGSSRDQTLNTTNTETLAPNVTATQSAPKDSSPSEASIVTISATSIAPTAAEVTPAASVTPAQSVTPTESNTTSKQTDGPRPFGLNTENTENTDDVYDEEGLTDLAIETSNEKSETEKPDMEPVEKSEYFGAHLPYNKPCLLY